jgi:hypothetical protein
VAVTSITIINRRDCCKDRLKYAIVFLLDANDRTIGFYSLPDMTNVESKTIGITDFNIGSYNFCASECPTLNGVS